MNCSGGLLISISGPSGVGKNTVITEVRKQFPDFRHSVSVTTRKPRTIDAEGNLEQEGVHYFFRSRDEFLQMAGMGEILEYDEFAGNLYGTPSGPLKEMVDKGQNVLLDLTIAGSLALKEKFGDEAVTVFLAPPSLTALRERLEGRGSEPPEVIERRLKQAEVELKKADRFDYIVVNDDLDEAVARVEDIIRSFGVDPDTSDE